MDSHITLQRQASQKVAKYSTAWFFLEALAGDYALILLIALDL